MTLGLQRFILFIATAMVCSCGYYDRELVFFDIEKNDFKWISETNQRENGSVLFVYNDSIFVNDYLGKTTKYISNDGTVRSLDRFKKSNHQGRRLSDYSQCTGTIDESKCKVNLNDSSVVKKVFLYLQGINSRISHPINFIEFTDTTNKKAIALDLGFIDINDIVQYGKSEFVVLFMYNSIDEETGKYFVGLLDLRDNLEREGDNGGEYLLNKTKKLKDKLNK